MSIATKSWVKRTEPHNISVRIAMTFVFAAAWLIPIVFLSYFIFHNYQKAYIEKTEKLLQDTVNVCCTLVMADLDTAITKVQKPAYESEWESYYSKYNRGDMTRAELAVAMQSSLISKIYMDGQFSRFAFYLSDYVIPVCYSGKNGYSYSDFIINASPAALNVLASDSESTVLRAIDNQLYLVRNLFTVKDHVKYGTLVVGLDKENLFAKFPLENDRVFQLKIDDEILSTSYDAERPMEAEKRMLFSEDYKGSNYEFGLTLLEREEELYRDVRELNKVVNVILFAMIPLIIVSYFFLTNQIEKPLRKLIGASGKIREGEFGSVIEDRMPNKEFEELANSFNEMSTQVKHLIETVYMEQIATKDALIDSLQAQINPHFINNTLEMMNWQARMNGDLETGKMVESLGVVLDFSMNRNHNRLVRLSDELYCADAFLYIMSMRFGQRLKVEKNVSEDLYGRMVPSLILQPLLENAIKHGVERVSQGTIWLNIFEENEKLIIDIVNTGKEMDEDELERIRDIIDGRENLNESVPGVHTSIGIFNVNKRIRLIFGDEYGLSVSILDGNRFRSRIVIPG